MLYKITVLKHMNGSPKYKENVNIFLQKAVGDLFEDLQPISTDPQRDTIYSLLAKGLYDKERYYRVYQVPDQRIAPVYNVDLCYQSYEDYPEDFKVKVREMEWFESASKLGLLANTIIQYGTAKDVKKFIKAFPGCPLNELLALDIYADNKEYDQSLEKRLQKQYPLKEIEEQVQKEGFSHFDKFSQHSNARINYYIALGGMTDFKGLFKPYIDSFFRTVNHKREEGENWQPAADDKKLIEVFEKCGIFQEDIDSIFSDPKNDNLAGLKRLDYYGKLLAEDSLVVKEAIEKLESQVAQQNQQMQ